MENNIFNIDMSELVHDNILSWIIKGFNSSDKNSSLYKVSVEFLILMGIEVNSFSKVIVKQQYKIDLGIKEGSNVRSRGYVDILARFLNDNESCEQYLVIEDKIYTEEHDDQFRKYIKGILDDKNLNIRENTKKMEDTKFVYIKLGKIPNVSKVKAETVDENKKSWKVITSGDILRILPTNFQENAFNDCVLYSYKEFLIELEKNYNTYRNIQLDKWSEHSIFGFFDYLAQKYPSSNFQFKGIGKNGHGEFLTNEEILEISDNYKYKISIQLKLNPPEKLMIFSKDIEDKSKLDYWKTSIIIKNMTVRKSDSYEKLTRVLNKYFELDKTRYPIIITTEYSKSATTSSKNLKEVSSKDFVEDTEDLIKSFYSIEINKIRQLFNEDSIE